MITLERRLAGIIPYRTHFFPIDAVVGATARGLNSTEIAKLFWTTTDLDGGRCVLRHYVSATVCRDLEDRPEEVLQTVSKTCRYEIRQAEKLGSRIKVRRKDSQASRDFVSLYNNFARSKRGVSRVTDNVFDRYRDHADTFVVYLDEKPMCGHMVLRDADSARVRLLYSASRRLDDKESARLCGSLNRFLHLHEIALYREEGFRTYDFGGIQDGGSDGITRFKLSFGGRVVTEHTYLCAGRPRLARLIVDLFENLSMRGRRWRPLVAKDAVVTKHW
jgi:Acetyltransferase (GNAT) domain